MNDSITDMVMKIQKEVEESRKEMEKFAEELNRKEFCGDCGFKVDEFFMKEHKSGKKICNNCYFGLTKKVR